MKTISIKGKDYVMVNERIKAFRENFKGYALITNIIELNEEICVIQANVIDENGRVVATGTAREVRTDSSSMVNKTSYVENCETSAWGRALGNLGIGIDDSIATFEEVSNAIEQQRILNTPMDFYEAIKRTTPKGKLYGDCTDEELELIISNSTTTDRSKEAARIILKERISA